PNEDVCWIGVHCRTTHWRFPLRDGRLPDSIPCSGNNSHQRYRTLLPPDSHVCRRSSGRECEGNAGHASHLSHLVGSVRYNRLLDIALLPRSNSRSSSQNVQSHSHPRRSHVPPLWRNVHALCAILGIPDLSIPLHGRSDALRRSLHNPRDVHHWPRPLHAFRQRPRSDWSGSYYSRIGSRSPLHPHLPAMSRRRQVRAISLYF
ncbi:hypothetical protein PMAYCL1PPCAC_00344, partial [Pristionchus mayeri]